MLRILLDENLPAWVAGDLRARGMDAVDIRQAAGTGLPDDQVYRVALRQGRHLVSANYKDFGNPLLYPPTKHTGIIVVRMPRCSIRMVAEHVLQFLSHAKGSELSRHLNVLEPRRIRRRKLA